MKQSILQGNKLGCVCELLIGRDKNRALLCGYREIKGVAKAAVVIPGDLHLAFEQSNRGNGHQW